MVVSAVQVETAEVWADGISESLEGTKPKLMSLVGKRQVGCRTGSNGQIYCSRVVT